MHYGPKAFAIDRRKPTIVKLRNTGGPIGQRKGFSHTDLAQLNALYNCERMYLFMDKSILTFGRISSIHCKLLLPIYLKNTKVVRVC